MTFRPIVITVTDSSVSPFERRLEPVRIGVSSPRGVVSSDAGWRLTNQSGNDLPVQTTILDRWSDSTVRWLLLDFQADLAAGGRAQYTLEPAEGVSPPPTNLAVTRGDASIRVSTGPVTFELPLQGPGFITSVRSGENSVLQSASITAEAADGTDYQFSVVQTTVALAGPLRVTVRLEGRFVNRAGQGWLDGQLQMDFFAGLGSVGAELTVTNPRAVQHPGGTWDLGDPASALIRDLSIQLGSAAADPEIAGSLDEADPITPGGRRFSVYQDSSGGVNWQHINHVNRDGQVPVTFRGFRAERGGTRTEGLRATPIASIGKDSGRISGVVPKFWQMCPKEITAEKHQLAISVLPRAYGDLHELQGGERTTLRFGLGFGVDAVSETPLAWMRSPSTVTVDSSVYEDAGVWAPIVAGSPSAVADYEALVGAAIIGEDAFAHRREVIDEYGWRNFGDLYADHEAVEQPLVSHYNNQYDALAGFIIRYLQDADARWWNLADDLALHVVDIDIYHTVDDKTAYSGGHFWHTQHYQPAGTATHRTYSRRSGSSGGGPSAEHNYTTGLMLHYFLTGAERSREAVIQLADWVIAMDDGSTTIFRWIDRGDTGFASGTRSADFHGPGRGAGASINALLDAHRLTGDVRYLGKAETLVARCIHPDDDHDTLELLDIENRWSYTVFLQVLGKYIEYRVERGWCDSKFAYARDALIKYAKWMCVNEQPYLHRSEQLEFPTETWAAQDIRKAAVFEWAAAYSTNNADRAAFLDRAKTFFEYATGYLLQSPTGRLTRPIVLLMTYGFQRPIRPSRPETAATIERASLRRGKFVPQRRRAIRRVALTGAALSVVSLIAIALWAL